MTTTTRGIEATTPQVGQVWIANDTGNYWRIDGVDGNQVSVTRLGYAQDSQDYITPNDSYAWDMSTFRTKTLRIIARKSAKFEAFLARNAVNPKAEPSPCRECRNVNYHQRDCSSSNWERTGTDTIVRDEDREEATEQSHLG